MNKIHHVACKRRSGPNPPPPLFKRAVRRGGWASRLVSRVIIIGCLLARGLRVLLSFPWRRRKVVSQSIDADPESSVDAEITDLKSGDTAIVADLKSSDEW
ncbi:hypothetical protein BDZ89DRAFT_1039970 [Hymenopellis radicata]|nr:hypothetical protein BDZ89DRAFT_1039970 [Hymenopellis radicata]